MKKCLIIQTAFLGDVILATALIEKLHVYYPDCQIDFLLRKGNEALLKQHPILNEVLVWDKQKSKYKNLMRLISKVRQNKYDLVVNLQRFAASGLIAGRSGAKHIVGFDKNPLSFLFHKRYGHQIGDGRLEVERNQQLIEDFTDENYAKPKLYPNQTQTDKVSQYMTASYVCLAPASVWETKRFPEEKWLELIHSEALADQVVYLLGGPSDHDLNERILKASHHPNIKNLAGALSLLESAALIKMAAMNYVNDSGPLHLASAMNAPVTAFFCSTVPEFGFGPLSDESITLETNADLACRPCGLHGRKSCPQGHFKCGYEIDIPETII